MTICVETIVDSSSAATIWQATRRLVGILSGEGRMLL